MPPFTDAFPPRTPRPERTGLSGTTSPVGRLRPALPPKNAFRYAFNHGADFVLAGMFDFEIAEDTQHAREAIASYTDRVRPWSA